MALASLVGTLSLMLRKAGEVTEATTRRVTLADLGRASAPSRNSHFVTIGVMRASKRQEYSVPVERSACSRAFAGSAGARLTEAVEFKVRGR